MHYKWCINALSHVVGDLLRHPIRHLVRKWNYKAAITSAVVRSMLFFAANLSSGFDAAGAAFLTEFALRFATSGFYGALTQALRRVEPARAGTVAALAGLPLVAHAIELLVHSWRGTANLGLSIAASLALTAVSTSFNLFAMRRGYLVVGDADSRPLADDLKALPAVARAFLRTCLARTIGTSAILGLAVGAATPGTFARGDDDPRRARPDLAIVDRFLDRVDVPLTSYSS